EEEVWVVTRRSRLGIEPSRKRLIGSSMALRYRILITLLPLLALLALLGGASVVLLHRLSGSIDAILRENYDSVIYMERLKESLERIDSSFTFTLAGQEEKA